MSYLEYKNTAETKKTNVEVAGLAEKVALPDDSTTAPKTVVSVEIEDSVPKVMPPASEGKSEALSVDIKLIAKIYDSNEAGAKPVLEEQIQPKLNQTVLVKLKLPTGFKLDTLEIWHVKDTGSRSLITGFWLVTEPDGTYALFEVASFSHFVFFAEKESAPVTDNSGNSGSSSLKPTVKPSDNGSVAVTPQNPNKGDTVTITPKPDEGYVVDDVAVKDKNGDTVPVTKKPDGSFSYTQPDGKVTITVTFKPENKDLPFTDVPENIWYRDDVRYVYEKGLMDGTGKDSFAPYAETTRGMIVTILWRLENQPKAAKNMSFNDVLESKYYYAPVKWAAEKEIVLGYDAQTFAPDTPITRQQLAAILYRYAAYKGYDVASLADLGSFTDEKSVDLWAKTAMSWAAAKGLITGTDNNDLDPRGSADRAQTAAILHRFCENVK